MSSFLSPGFVSGGDNAGIPFELQEDAAYQWLQAYYNRRLEPLCSSGGEVIFVTNGDLLINWTQPNAA